MLPENDIVMPPVEMAGITGKYQEWAAWRAGDEKTLAGIYGGHNVTTAVVPLIGRWLRKWFIGEAHRDNVASSRIHVALANDICRTSSNVLLSETVSVSSKDQAVSDRLALICGPQFNNSLLAAAESSAALGGVFLRVSYNEKLGKHAFISHVNADIAVPTFELGMLTSVWFYTVVATEGDIVWRHVESHDMDDNGIGIITHALYQGRVNSIGRSVSLLKRPETAWLDDVTDEFDQIDTGTPGLAVSYAPNVYPSSLWSSHAIGAYLGRSDLEGIEQQLDALDELHSSWLHDIRLGKGRLVVPQTFVKDLGEGKGATFDVFTTAYAPIRATPGAAREKGLELEAIQFEIRTEDHMLAIEHFKKQIISSAGYSPATFGLTKDDGAAPTATEIMARERATYMTRDRKIAALLPALTYIVKKALAMDALLFSSGVNVDRPEFDLSLKFADAVQPDPKAVAEQNSLDAASNSSSIRTRVANKHPEWDEKAIDEEVARIYKEMSLAASKAVPAVNDNAAPKADAAGATT